MNLGGSAARAMELVGRCDLYRGCTNGFQQAA
jgi:hypothetical protein